jgi:peptidoglycan/xylan/chitin deacetylase (PgdA/CDA1 family)
MKPAKYGPFPYSPITSRPKLSWPNGAYVALWVIPNIEFFALDENIPAAAGGAKVPVPDVPGWAVRDYGNRVGVYRMMTTMDKYGVRGTVALNSDVCLHHPEIIEAGNKLGWEWMGHNESNTRRLNALPPGEEKGVIERTLATIEKVSGKRPVGWLGSGLQETWDTVDLLAANGVQYVADWVNDDQPYQMTLDGGRSIFSVPYSHEINDKPAFEHHHLTAKEFQEMTCRQFDTLYREGAESGRVMAICLHPYITGVPHRIGALEGALDYISNHAHVWKATGAEIAEAYRAQMQKR